MYFFWERKNLCSSKFVQLLLLNRAKARWSENRAAQGFHYINSFISNSFWTQFKNVHLRGPCSLRLCISRIYCTGISERVKFFWKLHNQGNIFQYSSASLDVATTERSLLGSMYYRTMCEKLPFATLPCFPLPALFPLKVMRVGIDILCNHMLQDLITYYATRNIQWHMSVYV